MTDLCTLADVREYLQKRVDDTDQDALISQLITRATAQIERYCGREFADRGNLTRTRRVDGPLVDLAPFDLRTVTTMTLDPNGSPQVIAASDYLLLPVGGADGTGTYYQVRLDDAISLEATRMSQFSVGELQIAGAWGAATTPSDVSYACVITVGLWIRREVAAWSATFNPDVDVDATRPLSIPGAARGALQPYRRDLVIA